MASYSQPGVKRQKVREARVDSVDYFQGIEKVEFNNMATPSDTNCYRHYNSSERIHSRALEDWIKCSLSFTEFKYSGPTHGKQSHRPWDDSTNTMDNYKKCLKAFFDFCLKLGIKYWTAFDTDLVPVADTWEENKAHWDEIVEFIQELSPRSHVKLLWIAPDLHSYARYTSGAITSNEATTFVQAATQIKKCLEVSQRLNAESFLLWPHREGYQSYFQTDIPREIKLFSKLLKMAAEYKDRLNYRCQLLIMPFSLKCSSDFWRESQFWRENNMVKNYMWDVTSCLYFLKSQNLDKYYKVCTPPGHHMYMANVYNMLGGVTITDSVDHCDSKQFTLMMKCIVDQGTVPPGGINLKLSFNHDFDLREMVTFYAKYIDNIARALRIACNIISEQICSKHVQQRYSSYYSGIGARITSGEANIEECEEYYRKNQVHQTDITSNKLEHFNMMFQRYLESCDHV